MISSCISRRAPDGTGQRQSPNTTAYFTHSQHRTITEYLQLAGYNVNGRERLLSKDISIQPDMADMQRISAGRNTNASQLDLVRQRPPTARINPLSHGPRKLGDEPCQVPQIIVFCHLCHSALGSFRKRILQCCTRNGPHTLPRETIFQVPASRLPLRPP